jgi:glutaredoxin
MRKIFYLATVLMLAVGMQSVSAAKLYKWVDEFGNVTYRDTPPMEADGEVEEKIISGGSSVDSTSEAADAAAQSAPVVLYSTPSCSACNSARSYMKSRGVPFQDKNVQDNGELQQELKSRAGEISVPTILVGEKVMRGYVQSLLEDELTAAGYPKAGEEAAAPTEDQAEDQ